MSAETQEKTFTVPAQARISLSNIPGSIDVRAGVDGEVQVTATMHTDTGDAEHTEIRMKQDDDGALKIETRYDTSFWRSLFNAQPCQVDYVVHVPAGCVLKVSAVSSSCVADGLSGELSFTTVSGDLTLRTLDGKVDISAVSGDVSAENLIAALTLHTVSGDVKVRAATLSSVKADTVSGNVFIEGGLAADGSYRFSSVSGDVRLSLPDGAGCNAVLHTISGNISTNAATRINSRSHGSQVVELRGGGVKVYMNSVSGDLWLELSGADTSPAPINRREVLEAIERGDLSVEDGLAQLA